MLKALRSWFLRRRRDLPWRRARDPYRIWVSEIMLQQTRAAAVVPYFEKFLQLFPDVTALARARESTVLRCWSGLGYYSRARNLRRAARSIVSGGLPRTYADWLELPGIGPYTAAAIASIAFDEPVAVLDGNVARVIARLTNYSADIGSARARNALRQKAQDLLDRRHPGDFNQALMELGATVCLPRRPRCRECPIARWCQARLLGVENELPLKRRRQNPVAVRVAVALARRNGRLLLRPARSMPGFWELPEAPDGWGRSLGVFRHSITNHQYSVEVRAGSRSLGGRWVPVKKLETLPLTTVARKALALANTRHSRTPAAAAGTLVS